LDGDEKKAN
jgi:hypothetical protein